MVLLVLMAISAPVSALSVNIPADANFTFSLPALRGDNITYSWTASESVSFNVRDPNGDILYSTGGLSHSGMIRASSSGQYSLQWFNSHSSSVRVSYDASSTTLDRVRGPLLDTIIGLIAVLVVIIIVVVIVVVLVVGRREQPIQQGQATYYPYSPTATPPLLGQYFGPRTAEGRCPRCGSVVSAEAAFCLKCGARLK